MRAYDGSFPFLNVARTHGVPYADVIRFVDGLPGNCEWWRLSSWQSDAHDEWLFEADRRWRNRGGA